MSRKFLGWEACFAFLGFLTIGVATSNAIAQEARVEEPTVSGSVSPSSADLNALMKRLDDLEAANQELRREVESTRALQRSYEELERKYDELSRILDDQTKPSKTESEPRGDEGEGPDSSGGGTRLEDPQPADPKEHKRLNLKSYFDFEKDAFTYATEDDEYQLRIRGFVMTDARIYQQGGQEPTHGGFYIPRARLYVEGHMTKPLEYQISLQRGWSGLNILNAYLNFRYDDRFRLKVGRYKTPYTYEYYKINSWRLLVPERSLFKENFALNRQLGLMGWGELFEKRLEYAVGIFDGPRNSYQDYNDAKDVIAFLNYRPFQTTDGPLKNFNVGGSVDFGNQRNPLRPAVLRTSLNASASGITGSSAANNAAVPFLAFNQGVLERGDRALWELHMAYYGYGLTFLASWEGAFTDYGRIGQPQNVKVPIGGYDVMLGYLITGETISERGLIKPLHPFDLRPGKFGIGAIEPFVRWSGLTLGEKVFTAGLADPNLWTNRADQLDLGTNWHLTEHVRVSFDWEHSMFADPVYFAPGPRLQKTSDLFWFRFQVYY